MPESGRATAKPGFGFFFLGKDAHIQGAGNTLVKVLGRKLTINAVRYQMGKIPDAIPDNLGCPYFFYPIVGGLKRTNQLPVIV